MTAMFANCQSTLLHLCLTFVRFTVLSIVCSIVYCQPSVQWQIDVMVWHVYIRITVNSFGHECWARR